MIQRFIYILNHNCEKGFTMRIAYQHTKQSDDFYMLFHVIIHK